MNANFFSPISDFFHAIGAMLLGIFMSVSSFFGYVPPVGLPTVITPEAETQNIPIDATSDVATSTTATGSRVVVSPPAVPVATSTGKKTVPVPTPAPEKTPDTTPVVVGPCQTNVPVSTGSSTMLPTGTTTLAVDSVPLLSGGTAHAGGSVPVSYLQITNIGKECTVLKGFWVTQNGSAPAESVIGLTTVDDKGGSRGSTGGTEGASPFQNGSAFAPTDALFAPGQMRLFTIKAVVTQNVAMYAGMQLMIDVTSIESTATMRGQFPIRGTTWVIAQ